MVVTYEFSTIESLVKSVNIPIFTGMLIADKIINQSFTLQCAIVQVNRLTIFQVQNLTPRGEYNT